MYAEICSSARKAPNQLISIWFDVPTLSSSLTLQRDLGIIRGRNDRFMKKKPSSKRAQARSKPTPSAPRKTTRPFPARASIPDELRQNILFAGVTTKILQQFCAGLPVRTYKAGELIFDEYSKGRDLFVILAGRIRIKKQTKFGVESLLAVLHEADFFGELSLIDGLPRSARAEAMDDCTLAVISASAFQNLVAESPEFTLNLLSNLAVRLRTMDQTFVLELGRNSLAAKNKLDKLNLLIEASKIVNSAIELDKVLTLILDVATQSIGADRGTLYLMDEAANELWSKVAQGSNMVEIRLPVGKGLAGYVAKTGETVNIADAYKDPRFNPEIDKKSGYRTRNVLCMPMRNKDGNIVGVFQFLNKREGAFTSDDDAFIEALSVHAAIALENARMAKEMVQSERMSAVGRMASTIIHDIKNPMGTLRMYAQVIKKKTGNTEAAQLADEIIRQVDRFVNMTQEILDFSRGVSEIHTEEVNLNEVMESALSFIEKDLAKRNISVVREFGFDGICVMDVEKMVRVFYNLATNAADAMAEGGALTVTTLRKDNTLVIEFTDTGQGIPPEIKAHVFEPFFTFGKKHGTGLGLAICKKIVDDHNGSIEINSEIGKGTTIRLLFPLA
jgi:signal transduction histidine kinase